MQQHSIIENPETLTLTQELRQTITSQQHFSKKIPFLLREWPKHYLCVMFMFTAVGLNIIFWNVSELEFEIKQTLLF